MKSKFKKFASSYMVMVEFWVLVFLSLATVSMLVIAAVAFTN